MRRVVLALLCLPLCLLCLSSCSSNTTAAVSTNNTPVTPSQWVVAWGASSQNAGLSATNPGGTEQSFRFLVLPSVGATQERVHFTNQFGTTPITIGGARLAVSQSGAGVAIDTTRDVPLTEHNSQVSNNYATPAGAGNQLTDAAGTTFTQVNQEWYLLGSVEAYGPYQGTVAFFGSSSVDGHNANFGNTNSYPTANVADPTLISDRPTDWLARSLNSAGYSLGVLNAGVLANPAAEDSVTATGISVAGIDRFQHDVVQQPGIKAVVVYIGGIDLRSACAQATDVESALTNIVAQAYKANIRVILGTLPPSEYCMSSQPLPTAADPYAGDLNPGPENTGSTQRRAVNTWIRTTGAQLPGVVSVADFDQVMAYPAHPDFFYPNMYSNDNFHPNGAGYGVQNSAIPLTSLLGQ